MDSNGCYWLNPADPDVQDYLVSIAQALAELGFDEVVFDSFYFPDSQNIVFEGDKQAAVAAAAKAIREKLEDTPIRVSFGSSDADVAASADRVYLTSESGAEVAGIVEQLSPSLEIPPPRWSSAPPPETPVMKATASFVPPGKRFRIIRERGCLKMIWKNQLRQPLFLRQN